MPYRLEDMDIPYSESGKKKKLAPGDIVGRRLGDQDFSTGLWRVVIGKTGKLILKRILKVTLSGGHNRRFLNNLMLRLTVSLNGRKATDADIKSLFDGKTSILSTVLEKKMPS